MFGLVVMEVMTLSGHLSNINEIALDTYLWSSQKMLTKEEHQKLVIIKGFHPTNEHELSQQI